MSKITVIHHSADMDGLFCREIARKFLPDAELIGWDFGDKPLEIPKEGTIYILDLPVDRPFGVTLTPSQWGEFGKAVISSEEYKKRIIWIDHHKSSIESHPKDIPGYRINGVAACRLAWQWFAGSLMPEKDDFVNRTVREPLAVRLAGEYDIWDRKDPRAELFQHGLRSRDLNGWWEAMLSDEATATIAEIENKLEKGDSFQLLPNGNLRVPGLGDQVVANLLKRGEALQYARTQENASIIKDMGFTFQWEGLTFLACNAARYNSHLFTAALRPEHDACFGFKFTGHVAGGKPHGEWSVSLYHAPGKEHHDLSLIAVKHGGGGHRGACGFKTEQLPFLK